MVKVLDTREIAVVIEHIYNMSNFVVQFEVTPNWNFRHRSRSIWDVTWTVLIYINCYNLGISDSFLHFLPLCLPNIISKWQARTCPHVFMFSCELMEGLRAFSQYCSCLRLNYCKLRFLVLLAVYMHLDFDFLLIFCVSHSVQYFFVFVLWARSLLSWIQAKSDSSCTLFYHCKQEIMNLAVYP